MHLRGRKPPWLIKLPPRDMGGMRRFVSLVLVVSLSPLGSWTGTQCVDATDSGEHAKPLAGQWEWAIAVPQVCVDLVLAKVEGFAAAGGGEELPR